MMRRMNTRLLFILAAAAFLLFMVNQLYHTKRSQSDALKPSRGDSQKPGVVLKSRPLFNANTPASCVNHPQPLTSKHSVTVVISTDSSNSLLTRTVSSVLSSSESSRLKQVIITSSGRLSDERLSQVKAEFAQHKLLTFEPAQHADRLTNKLLVARTRATGSAVVFVDDTAVLSDGYLLPLLHALDAYPKGIAVSLPNYLTREGLLPVGLHVEHKWVFDWSLSSAVPFEMGFGELASRSETELILSAAFDSRSVFALTKSFVVELELLRPGLSFYNDLDLSFSVWSCADGIHIVPCSGFGQTAQPLPGNNGAGSVNGQRTAALHVKADKYRRVVRAVGGETNADVEKPVETQAGLLNKCPRSFDWLMETIVSGDVYTPSEDVRAFGRFVTARGTPFARTPAMLFLLNDQPYARRGSTVEYLKTGQLRMDDTCLVISENGYIVADVCNYENPRFKWEWTSLKQFAVRMNDENRCISHSTDPYPENKNRQALMYTICVTEATDPSAKFQAWNSFTWF